MQQPAGADARVGRASEIDVLRVLALLGVAVVNASYLGSIWTGPVPGTLAAAVADQVVRAVVLLVFETKFYLLFSFLFGYSFALQVERTAAAGGRFRGSYLRRLAGLFGFGVAHAVLLFPGDILTVYAVLGLVLLAAHRVAPRTQAWAGVAVLLYAGLAFGAAAVASAAAQGWVWLPVVDPGLVDAVEDPSAGGPLQVLAGHLRDWPYVLVGMWGLQGPGVLAMLLLGHAAGRTGLLQDHARLARYLPRIQRIGFTLGVPGAIALTGAGLYASGQPAELAALAVNMVTAPLLAAAFAATLLGLLARRRAGDRLRTLAAPAGRMTLTHYLGQSLIGALLYTGYGLDLGGNLPAAVVIGIAGIVFAAQVALSGPWLRRHAYGPAEWLLRALTHRQRPPWRRPTPVDARA